MSEFELVTLSVTVLFGLWIAYTTIKILAPREQMLLTRFGGNHVGTFEKAGIHVKLRWPITIVANRGRPISTQLQQVDETLETKTIDDVFIGLPISVQFEIHDSAVFVFNNDQPIRQMRSLVAAEVRRYAAKKDSQEIYDERE
jgi:regulator of protease activity HflC (stomatin/prohibitin superfamily)